jgi:hypothetical protein
MAGTPYTIAVQNKASRLAEVFIESGVDAKDLEALIGAHGSRQMWANAAHCAGVGAPSRVVIMRCLEILRNQEMKVELQAVN